MALFGNGHGAANGRVAVGLYRTLVMGALALLIYLARDKLESIEEGVAAVGQAATELRVSAAALASELQALKAENAARDRHIERLEDRLNRGPR